MKRLAIIVVLLGMVFALAAPVVGEGMGAAPVLINPPAIYMPAGGKVVTEINISDDDVLGIIKQALPAVADVVKDIAPTQGGKGQVISMVAGTIDPTGLSDAISGIKNIRLLVVKYPSAVSAEKFLDEFSKGAAKAGQFSKILSDFGTFPGAVGVYALPNNAGCMGFAYIPKQQTAYVARVVGGVDVPKLIKWAGGIAKMAIGTRTQTTIENQPASVPETAEPATPSAGGEGR